MSHERSPAASREYSTSSTSRGSGRYYRDGGVGAGHTQGQSTLVGVSKEAGSAAHGRRSLEPRWKT